MSLSIQLKQYADSLAPSSDILEKAGAATKHIQDVLHRHLGSKFSIDRIRPLGSLTKKTSLWFKMDIDVIIYLNDEMPPFSKFKQKLDDVITMNIDEDCKQSPLGLSLTVKGFDVDLLPARNFLYSNGYSGETDEIGVQVANTLQHLRNNRRGNHMDFSTSLSEGAVAFERNHSAFSHSLSRLAKFWSTTIGIPGFSFGRSSIMEYLGAWAAEEEERRGSRDILQGFRRFLTMVKQSHNLNIVWTRYYRRTDIPADILHQRPLLLDPTNPYNNMLQGALGDNLRQMSTYATETLSRLDKSERNGGFSLKMIFEPQPTWRVMFKSPKVKTPQHFLVGTERKRLLRPKIEKRSGARGVDPSIASSYLFSFTDIVAAAAKIDGDRGFGQREDIVKRVQSALEQFIDPGTWTPTSERHEDRHTTFTIPIGKDATDVIKISCNWV
ncbi:2'-5'-oligoadenylate synthase-like protein 2 [Apostichopus japonicus]|uniref:2'-5'-oligoadenylate synthase-like protein 2 n=1 Tax=Stichopus japonicus TaxID=307972 RepID=UPI003AB35765